MTCSTMKGWTIRATVALALASCTPLLEDTRDAEVSDGARADASSCADGDGDGHADEACGGTDCDDGDDRAHPGAIDGCGDGDQDCDGSTDEDGGRTFYRDADEDGFGTELDTVSGCVAPDGYVEVDGDCRDDLAAVHPGEGNEEICDGSGLDEDCDGSADEGCECEIGMVIACGPATDVGACRFGEATCDDDGILGECFGAIHASTEECDGGTDAELSDEDCDGTIDEGCECTNAARRTCADAAAVSTTFPALCTAVMQTCVDGSWPGPCEDEVIVAPVSEVCDGTFDEDCDGEVDEDCDCTIDETRSCGTDTGLCTVGSQTCGSGGTWGACSGVGSTAEVCDHLDQDCDGWIDDGSNQDCTYSATTNLGGELYCFPGSGGSCSGLAFGHEVQLGWNILTPWMPGSGEANARTAYLPTSVDFPTLGFSVEGHFMVRKMGSTSLGDGVFGVMISPRRASGTEADYAMPRLTAGQIGFAAAVFPMSQVLRIYELRDGAAPVERASEPYSCLLTTGDREIWLELEYALGTWSATAQGGGCTTTQVYYTPPSSTLDAMYVYDPTHPHYYPGFFGDDRSGGTVIRLSRIDVQRTWGCDGCPW